MIFVELFIRFFFVGLFAIGGGLATIPFLMDMSDNYGWFTREELSNMIAVSESTPGPIGINMATYVGFTTGSIEGGFLGGFLGSIISTTALVLPSLVIIMIIAGFLAKFQESKLVKDVFYCLRPAVIGLLGVSLAAMVIPLFFDFTATAILDIIDLKAVILFSLLLFGILKFKKHPILYIAIGAVVGIIFKF